jgi:hypothetical protein
MNTPVPYMGDTSPETAASYLAGVLVHFNPKRCASD